MSNLIRKRLIFLAPVAISGLAWSQTIQHSQPVDAPPHFEHAIPASGIALQSGVAVEGLRAFTTEFIGGEFGVSGKTIKNAPYSADAVTETTQVLADGNRIRHTNSTQVVRDSQGRTRRESALNIVGLAPKAELPKLVFISDPVAGFSYVLNLKERTASKTKIGAGGPRMATLHTRLARGPAEDHQVQMRVAEGGGEHRTEVRAYSYSVRSTDAQKGKTETLARQNIEGVIADGTRTTFSIPAGEIGNEKPIDIVSERWFSPELQTVVMTRHNDPRAGDTTFRLTNISRSEPAPSLFEVPADFKVTEGSGDVFRLRVPAPPKQ